MDPNGKEARKSDDESNNVPAEGGVKDDSFPKSKSEHRNETIGERNKEREKDRDRDRDRDRDWERERIKSRDRDRGRDSDREREREDSDRDKARERRHRSKDGGKDSGLFVNLLSQS